MAKDCKAEGMSTANEFDRLQARIEELESALKDHEQTVEALRDEEERLKFVLEGSQLGLWDWDIQRGKVQRNARWAEMLGYTLTEIDSSTEQWHALLHPEDSKAAGASIQAHVEGQSQQHELEYRMRCKDGHYKWILDVARVVKRDKAGQPLRMCGTHTDITERKNSEQALRDSLRTAAHITQFMPSGLFIYQHCPPDSLILVDANPAALRQTGLALSDIVGREFDTIWPKALGSGLTADLLKVMRTKSVYETEEFLYEDKKL
jgi:PAS domain S-box-containing protein